MVLVKSDVVQAKLISNDRFSDIPQDHMARFLVDFIDEFLIEELMKNWIKSLKGLFFPRKLF